MRSNLLAPHPRLCFGPERSGRLEDLFPQDMVRRAAGDVARQADEYLADSSYDRLSGTHNAHLLRARRMQSRVLTLIAQWTRTADVRYRDAVVAHVDAIGEWEYWSWIAWRRQESEYDAIFDLTYGENSATLAFAYDLLFSDLEPHERKRIVDIARRRSLGPLLQILERGNPWWFGKPDTNWNPVCAGGVGMLALAMYEDLVEAREIPDRVEESIGPFLRALEETDGGFPEGIGYWNYGMRYAFMYLLSFERSRRAEHRLLRSDAVRKTLAFPLDFYPHSQPCSFGDGNHWAPMPIHFVAADHLGVPSVVSNLRELAERGTVVNGYQNWPQSAETMLLADTRAPAGAPADGPDDAGGAQVRLYSGLGWTRLADRWPNPDLYLSVRGGTTEVPHGHLDLLSFHVAVKDERLIENLTPVEYLDTTFGPRRLELFEMAAPSKNVPLIDGVGISPPVRVDPVQVQHGTAVGVRLDATAAIGTARQDEPLAALCARLFLMLEGRAILIADRVQLKHEGRVESRLHTRAGVTVKENGAHLAGERQSLTVALAANHPFSLTTAPTVPTTPGDDATVLRWCGPLELGEDYWMVALLAPGYVDATVRLEPTPEGMCVRAAIDDWSTEVALRTDLELVNVSRTSGEKVAR